MESLTAAFRSEQLELARAIGVQGGPLKDRVLEVFKALPDPLLSPEEVSKLLGSEKDPTVDALAALHAEGALEKSTTTSRPLDSAGVVLYRLAGVPFVRLKLVGIESRITEGASRLQFTCDGRLIRSIARVDRLDAIAATGNQRDEINSHVHKIAHGIEAGTQIPNPVLLVFLAYQVAGPEDEEAPASFIRIVPMGDYTRVPSPVVDGTIVQEFRPVQIDLPFRRAAFDEEKSALLVDGQQRTAALSLVDIEKVPSYSLSINAEIADSEQAKTIFIVANSTAKIETQFSRALLASMDQSPGYLASERPKALAAKILALDDTDSPFYGLVQYPGAKNAKRPPIAYNSLFQVVSIFAESGLPLGDQSEKTIARLVARGFALVKKTWESAWGLKPSESRLMHGVGLRSLATLLVNRIEALYTAYGGDVDNDALWAEIEASLRRLQPHLIWRVADTANALKGAVKMYNEEISQAQNTSQDISSLTKAIRRLSLELDTDATKAVTKSKKQS